MQFRPTLASGSQDELFYVLVNSTIYSSVESGVNQYVADLQNEGYSVEIHTDFGDTPEETRSFLASALPNGLVGAFFVGDTPEAWFKNNLDGDVHPIDLFYMDLDGTWIDSDGDNRYDVHEGDVEPEIYVGRLKASNIDGDEVTMINNYFEKIHNYRIGNLSLSRRALVYVDDDWAGIADSIDECLKQVYDETILVKEPRTTKAKDYKERITEEPGYEWVHLCCHGAPTLHKFKLPNKWNGIVTSEDYRTLNPKAMFYNLFVCLAARYTEQNNLASTIVLTTSYGLLVVGATDSGGLIGERYFYSKVGKANSVGVAFKEWFIEYGEPDTWWTYGLTIIGDPTLKTTTVSNIDTGLGYHSIQMAINADETLDGHTIKVRAGTYYENVVVNKSLTLVGKAPETTIIDGNGTGDVVNVQSDAVTISQFTIQNGKLGIRLEYSDGASISDNIISDNRDCGMYLYNCVNSTVSGNTVTENRYYVGGIGILIDNWQSNDSIGNNVVTDNIASGNSQNGIWVFHSDDNLIKNNTAKDNDDNGIYLYASRYNEIAENDVINNGWRGINLYGSIDNVIHHNNFIDNRENAQCGYPYPNTWWDESAGEGNYWNDYTGQDSDGDGIGDTPYVIDAGNQDNYPLMHPWGSIRNVDTGLIYLTIQKAIDASETRDDHTVEVKGGTYYENVVVNKSLTLIGENSSTTIIDGGDGGIFGEDVITIELEYVTISGFTIQNGRHGVYLYSCVNGSMVRGNILSNNFVDIYLTEYTENCTIKGNILVSNSSLGIYLEQADYNNVSGNMVSNINIKLLGSEGNTVIDNILSNSGGIQIYNSTNTTVIGNMVSNSAYGIYLNYTGGNVIHHNNFINNTIQALCQNSSNIWNSSNHVGNYWSDYNGTDNYSGPYQNETGSDGIGDTTYPIPENNQDDYPLMWKWFPGDLDGDGDVDDDDRIIFMAAYVSEMGDPNYNPIADLDYDCDVDFYDYVIFIGNY